MYGWLLVISDREIKFEFDYGLSHVRMVPFVLGLMFDIYEEFVVKGMDLLF